MHCYDMCRRCVLVLFRQRLSIACSSFSSLGMRKPKCGCVIVSIEQGPFPAFCSLLTRCLEQDGGYCSRGREEEEIFPESKSLDFVHRPFETRWSIRNFTISITLLLRLHL